MNILLYTIDYKPLVGGISTYSYELAKGLHAMGYNVIVLAPTFPGSTSFDKKQPFKTYRVPQIPLIKYVLFYSSILKIIKKHQISILFSGMWFPCGLIALSLWKLAKLPYIQFAYGLEVLDSKRTLLKRIKTRLRSLRVRSFNNARKVIAISQYTKRKLIESGVNPCNIAVVPCGVHLKAVTETTPLLELKKKYNIQNKKVLLTVARLDYHKGHDVVIKSLPLVLKQVPDLHYVIVGKGPREEKLREFVQRLHIEEHVSFLKEISNTSLDELYQCCDLFIMASREMPSGPYVEGFGIVFLEAGLYKKPVIGGNSGGIPDAIIDGKSGLLVNPIDHKEVAQKIITILTDEQLAKELGKNGLKNAQNHHWQKITQQILEVISF